MGIGAVVVERVAPASPRTGGKSDGDVEALVIDRSLVCPSCERSSLFDREELLAREEVERLVSTNGLLAVGLAENRLDEICLPWLVSFIDVLAIGSRSD